MRPSTGLGADLSDQVATRGSQEAGQEGRGRVPQGAVTMGYYAWGARRVTF